MNLDLDLTRLDSRSETAVAGGLLSSGTAHRVGLAARLAATSPQEGEAVGPAVISGQALAGIMGLSRAAVHKHMQHLQALGFSVTSAPGKGYRLESPFTDLVAAEAVLPFLLGSTRREKSAVADLSEAGPPQNGLLRAGLPYAGLPYLYLERCESTNLVLREAMTSRGDAAGFAAGRTARSRRSSAWAPAGAVVVTDAQTGGRGRLNRTWSSRPGKDLTFSILLRPSLLPGQAHLLSLTAALAVAEVLETMPGLKEGVAVKWPNDVLLGERKVCGILLEGSMDADRLQWAVAGIGLNVNSASSALMTSATPEQAADWGGKPQPVSLREHLGHEVPRAPLLAALLDRLGVRWAALGSQSPSQAEVLDQLRRRDALAGRPVEVVKATGPREPAVVGEAVGIGPEGQLLVRQASGQVLEVFAGDVTVRSAGDMRSSAETRAGL